jgi:hypothetical protein
VSGGRRVLAVHGWIPNGAREAPFVEEGAVSEMGECLFTGS